MVRTCVCGGVCSQAKGHDCFSTGTLDIIITHSSEVLGFFLASSFLSLPSRPYASHTTPHPHHHDATGNIS